MYIFEFGEQILYSKVVHLRFENNVRISMFIRFEKIVPGFYENVREIWKGKKLKKEKKKQKIKR